MDDKAYHLEKRLIRQSFNRAAHTYDGVAVLQQEINSRLLERLEYIRLQPTTVLDLGAGTGDGVNALNKFYRKANVIGLDMAENMLAVAMTKQSKFNFLNKKPTFVCGDAERLPLADNSVDMIVSNLALQWCIAIDDVFRECRRILRPGGLFMFTTFGPDTLKELRESWQQVDAQSVHVNRFMDLHDLGDALLNNRFADPVMDMEKITLTYPDLNQMMRELKALGAHNVNAGRAKRLTGKQRLQALRQAYESFREEGRLPATYEVIYGHAWMPLQETQRSAQGQVETRIPLSSIAKMPPRQAEMP